MVSEESAGAVAEAWISVGPTWICAGALIARRERSKNENGLVIKAVQLTAAMAFLLLATIRGQNSVSSGVAIFFKLVKLWPRRFAGNGSGVPALAASAMATATREAARRSLAARSWP